MSQYHSVANEEPVDGISHIMETSRAASPSLSSSLGDTIVGSNQCSSSGSDSLPGINTPSNDENTGMASRSESPASPRVQIVSALAREGATFAPSIDAAERAQSEVRPAGIHHLTKESDGILCVRFLFLLGLAFLAGMIVGSWPHNECKSQYPDIVYSPARAMQEYRAVRFDGDIQTINPYKGPPSKALDEAWKALYDVGPFLVDKEELEAIGKESMELPSRPGKHLAKLAVFHQLHCLDYVRRYVHREHYRIDDSNATVSGIDHADHCIDMIRQALSCSADPTLITFSQKSPFAEVEADFSATHACTNFEKVHDWAKDQAINMTEEIIRNPRPFRDAVVAYLNG
ncbi:hypothetical protein TEQG_01362 [Trichophyton equinum CBS 127.97]|uniref:Tat pathway signal sequence n=1 Tax=Trichophyton equinum (strain ATCC MYA-4606 / CBS 127.97) TaxID=559882 RepID=F2PKA6_TRIEC|nr:hypothetical protein TEQG_01362 [Trichophyton equinum CBS 127.97]